MKDAKVLIIDDQEVNVEILAQVLNDAGYAYVEVETDPRIGLQRYENETFDLLLLDLLMPHMNGLEVLEHLRDAQNAQTQAKDAIDTTKDKTKDSIQDDAPTGARASEEHFSDERPFDERSYRPVIVLTADTSQEAKYQALSLGANDFITKPFDIQDVLLRTHNLLEARSLHLQLVTLNHSLEAKVAERTAALKQMYDKLQHDAFHDPLTDLPNRALFIDRLGQAISRYHQGLQDVCTVIFADFDRFKIVNDSWGYSAGNDLLIAIAERFGTVLGSSDSIARLHADEFALLIQVPQASDPHALVAKLQEAFVAPFNIAGNRLYLSMSLGVLTAENISDSAEVCLRNAELAMHQAKVSGKGQYQMFTRELFERTMMLLQLETHLRYASERDEFRLAFQPIICAKTDELVGFEALVRWYHSKYGLVSPGEFIPYAEETGLIVEIDRWVLRQACLQLRAWQDQFPALGLHINVNMTTQQLMQRDLLEHVSSVFADTGVDPHFIKFELTESMLLKHDEQVLARLQALRDMGTELYIDDFGTGYSSLSYLQTLNADALKIDRSFVQNLTLGEEGFELVRTIINIAQSLHMSVVAEGVETLEQYVTLRDLGCDFLQGYYMAGALTPDATQTFIEAAAAGNVVNHFAHNVAQGSVAQGNQQTENQRDLQGESPGKPQSSQSNQGDNQDKQRR